jgi:hypothetical protein
VKFKIQNSKRLINVPIEKYLIGWDTQIKRGKHFGKFQFEVKQLLRPYWDKCVVTEEFPVPAIKGEKGKSIDFVNFTTRQIIECDGVQHTRLSWNHKNKYQFLKQLQNDNFKDEWAELNGFQMIRIYETDVLDENLLKQLKIIS